MMTENGPSIQDRYTDPSDRTPWMAHPAGSEAPDRLSSDMGAVALAITVLLVIFALSSWLPS